jgi:hypothetical protein
MVETYSRMKLVMIINEQRSLIPFGPFCARPLFVSPVDILRPMAVLSAARKAQLVATAKKLSETLKRAPETLRVQTQAVRSWRKFAGAAVPTEELVWLYTVQEVDRMRMVSGIRTYLASIKAHFRRKDGNLDLSVFSSARIKEALWQGMSRARKCGVGVKRAVVVQESMVRRICRNVQTHDDLLFAAILVSLFFNISRGAEMVHPAHARSRLASKLPLYGNVTTSLKRTTIRMMSQKNAQFRAEDLHLTPANTTKWGLETMYRYARLRGSGDAGFGALPEFFVREDKSVPTTAWLTGRLKKALGSKYTVHGLRAGGATRLAKLGWSAFHIQMAGRWSSDYFLTYISQYPELAAALAAHNNLPQRTVRRAN